ncbi:spore germination protein [Candidatus Borkfalkia ceftriaxoniphila]|uniref:Spore germination protein n=1 Tax=Candidatus Borkfalkia ceftriaxoniphila TaxID=2508949 RepID=A0A4Q2KFG0_9FIRM|nr:spore germination protein [Candidatus Borkfalkia ceftriaxoniphila]RXZ61871.1 spore germination protein [Candidatus Borkfalkia ceftriaxoniphila]
MNKMNANLQKNVRAVKNILSAEDILVFHFETTDGAACAAIYADGICDKDLLGEQVIRPLSSDKRGDSIDEVAKKLTSPEVKKEKSIQAIADEVLSGNTALIVDGLDSALIIGVKKIPVRTITEPPTSIAVKGPREGFIEDIKTNMALLRKRLKTGDLQFETLTVGTRSKSMIAVCYLNGISDLKVKKQIVDRLKRIEIDGIPDASYIAKFLAKKPYSMFKQVGTTEKPDILAAKMLEGRIGIFVDGSPIALTLPYILVEDFQSVQDYLVSPYRATVSRLLRLVSLVIALLLPAYYVAAQLFKLQLLPLGLLMTISGNVRDLPLSPSLEMFFLMVILEILIEASVRMPKYVGLALSVVGALVLGDTAVKAGIVSSSAIIIVALSGIAAYTLPDLAGSLTLLRFAFLIVAGSLGTFGIVLFTGLVLLYLVTSDSYGAPLLAPFSPLITRDLKDSVVKADILNLKMRPKFLQGQNKVRLAIKDEEEQED